MNMQHVPNDNQRHNNFVHIRTFFNSFPLRITEIAIGNPFLSFISYTYSERGSELDKIIEDARIKYIMGVIDLAGWEAAVAKWRKDGGDKIIEEYTQAYNEVNQ